MKSLWEFRLQAFIPLQFQVLIANYKTAVFVIFGGEGGIRTLDELLTHTRVPVVRHKPG